jgi:hypothetical protein
MPKEKFLIVSWNNLLALGMGLIPLIYVVAAISTSAWTAMGGLIRLALTAVLYTNNVLDLTPQQFESYPYRIP